MPNNAKRGVRRFENSETRSTHFFESCRKQR
jgi:hypothetical protein